MCACVCVCVCVCVWKVDMGIGLTGSVTICDVCNSIIIIM